MNFNGIEHAAFKTQTGTYLSGPMDDGQANNFAARILTPTLPFTEQGGRSRVTSQVSPRAARDGHAHKGFADYYYGRVHVVPGSYHFGNLVSEQTRTVEVFNGYTEARELTAISDAALEGCVIAGPSEKTFAPLESVVYALTVSLDGAPSFEGRYEFAFDTETRLLPVSGNRVILFPFDIDSSTGVRETLAWMTDVMGAWSGREQRVRIKAYPRRRLEYAHLLETSHQRALFQNLLFGWQHRTFTLPVWFDRTYLTAPLAQGANSLNVSTVHMDYDAGGLVILWLDYRNYEIIEIEAVSAGAVSLKRPTGRLWPQGTQVMPARFATLPPQLSFTSLTNEMDEVKLVWQIKPEERSINRLAYHTYPAYRGVDVFDIRHNWSETPSTEVSRTEDVIDFGTGIAQTEANATGPQNTADFRALLFDRQEIAEFLGWIEQRAGRLNPVWVPSYKDDFELVQTASAIDTTLRVRDVGYKQFINMHPSRRDLFIQLHGGGIVYRRVTGVAAGEPLETGEATEVLSLNAALGASLNVGDGHQISYLVFARLNNDNVEMLWEDDETVTASFRFTELLTTP